MRVFRGFSSAVPTPTVLSIGNFDGMHLGHRALLSRLRAVSEARGLAPAVMTFEPHPREFFRHKCAPARLSRLREKLEHFAEAGVAFTWVCRFDARFAALTADAFVERFLVPCLRVKHVVIGDDFRFGAGREGDFSFLEACGRRHGFSVEATPTVLFEGRRVSSSRVRESLASGNLALASALLGRPYVMDGRVRHGDALGRTLGFPTANLYVAHANLPLSGVFAVEVSGLRSGVRSGVANLGVRPTLQGKQRARLEVHLFDFSENIYGEHLVVSFLAKLRDEVRFPDVETLKAQIARDVVAARAFFKSRYLHEGSP